MNDLRMTSMLAESAESCVYAAEQGGQRLALKVLRRELSINERERERFLAEAQLLAAVHHPGIVPLLFTGELPDGRLYLAMPLLEGETLAARLLRGRLERSFALALFGQIASALMALHGRGLLHRDLHPGNIFLTTSLQAVLLDLGIGRSAEAQPGKTTREGRVRGTPAYMAPERFFGAPATARSDVYELALVLYEMLVGRSPFLRPEDPGARLHPASHRDARLLPYPLAKTLLGALSTRPEVRPASVEEFRREILGRPTLAPSSPLRRTAELAPPREISRG